MPRNGRAPIQRAQHTPKKPLKIKEALHKGELLSGVRFNGKKVTLALKPQYHQLEKYVSINKALFDLYFHSEAFREKFQPPKRSENELSTLTLKDGHGYANDREILAALQAFAASKPARCIKKDLSTGKLLEDVQLEDNRATLVMCPKYAHLDNYLLINKLLYRMYRGSRGFAAKFELPTQNANRPILILKEGHGYKDGKAVLKALKNFAALSLKPLSIKEALAHGLLLSGVSLEGNCVILKLQQSYNKPEYYLDINQSLHFMYSRIAAFADKFERPKVSHEPPKLALKANHGYKNEAEIVMALRKFFGFVSEDPEKTQCIQQAVAPVEVPFDVTRYLEEIIPTTVPLRDPAEISAQVSFATAFPQALELASCSHQETSVIQTQIYTPQQVSNTIWNALIVGKLFSFAILFQNQADLFLIADYHHPNYYDAIISRVYDLCAHSAELQQKIEWITIEDGILRVQLRQHHGYQDGEALLTHLIQKALEKHRVSTYPERVQETRHDGDELGRIGLTPILDVLAQAITPQTETADLLSPSEGHLPFSQAGVEFETASRKSLAWLYQLQTSVVPGEAIATHESAPTPYIPPVTRFRDEQHIPRWLTCKK